LQQQEEEGGDVSPLTIDVVQIVSNDFSRKCDELVARSIPREAVFDLVNHLDACPWPVFDEEKPVTISLSAFQKNDVYVGCELANPSQRMVFKRLGKGLPAELNVKQARRVHIVQTLFNLVTRIFNCNVDPVNTLRTSDIKVYEDKASGLFYICEPYLDLEFVKYNNNCGYVSDEGSYENEAVQALCHFSYHFSRHKIMFVNLQGVGDRLVDVHMHTEYGCAFEGTDLNEVGMERFLLTHECNQVCKKLKLPPVEDHLY